MDKFYHSVRLDESLCKGCINCIKRCPTEAIRVRGGKASINNKFCIDCGECIRVCPHHAKLATYDKMDVMKQYEYTVALPAPSLYSQFNNLDDVNIVLNALVKMGFDDVFEVSAAAELVSEATRQYISEHEESSQKIFFDGQIYDAFSLIVNLIQKADKEINLIDRYVDVWTLNLLSKKKSDVAVTIYTQKQTKLTKADVKNFNAQYPTLKIKYTKVFHDRFLIMTERQPIM